MPTSLSELARLVAGTVVGDGATPIHRAATLGEAGPGDISFIENAKHLDNLAQCPAGALVVPTSLNVGGVPLIQVSDPLTAFAAIMMHFRGDVAEAPQGVDRRAAVDESAQVGADTYVAPFAVIGAGSQVGARCRIHAGVTVGARCVLGDDVILYPGVVLYDRTVLGNRVIVHANSVIGGDGFGYRLKENRHAKVPHLGHVEIGDDVEIGACTTIDRGTFQATRIGSGTKIDNLVQIAHNCQIGKHNLLVSQVGIAGSSSTGDYVVLAGQVGIVDHAHIGTGAIVGAKAGVTKNVPAGQRVLGAPATPEREQKRILMTMEKLPEIRRDLKRIKQHLGLADESAA